MNRDKRRADRTAEGVAIWRAMGVHEPDSSVRNPDLMAAQFLGPISRAALSIAPLRSWLMSHFGRRFPGAYGCATARTLHLDALFVSALEEGVEQVVLLGAGYDSRAYRFRERLSKARVFEVDLPATQVKKQQRLQSLFGSLPDWVRYVPIDFDTQRLEDVLPAAGFERSARTFFLWEGVSMYLTQEGVDQTLGFVVRNTPPGSSIAFDYVAQGALRGDPRYPGTEQWIRSLAEMGHPMTFGIEEDATERFLRERGLEVVSRVGSAELERRYLVRSNGDLLCSASSFLCIAHARVQGPVSRP
ncbi:SAM-dependent methyltransferase [Corallococcus sp. Z5C101001]|uniref:SAM-dependent methyltransferase n=1 Tax=Corallococcus sp. Z5C101001 TaxID=2596829 RepID=UPI00117EF5ED|nr:SAM-dependent methyltransferase [Corallococcus sp. Z5C101001]TSC24558.1 SAM-dependent methyltransferase [Corallococcus sp. Z5C101001]